MAEAMRHRSVPSPRSSNRTCGFPTFGFARGKVKKQFPSITATSASGYKQTLAGLKSTSALHPGADLSAGVAEGPFLTQAV